MPLNEFQVPQEMNGVQQVRITGVGIDADSGDVAIVLEGNCVALLRPDHLEAIAKVKSLDAKFLSSQN